MTIFPDIPFPRIALAAALACGTAQAAPSAHTGKVAGGDPSGIAWSAYTHAGFERSFRDRDDPYGPPGSEWDLYGTGLMRARFMGLEAGLAAGLRFWGTPDREAGYPAHGGLNKFYGSLEEVSLRWRFGRGDAQFGFGVMPLRGNPDALIFGNYLAEHDPVLKSDPVPYETLRKADTLGARFETVTGAGLSLGSPDAPLRAEGWIVREAGVIYGERDFSMLGYLSGSAARGIGWGLGVGLYRALPDRGDFLAYVTDDTGIVDSIVYDHDDFLIGGRLSLDLAPLIGEKAPKGHYGGLFAEAALLGAERKPYSRRSPAGRAAWTAGIRFPAFGWLDACAAQGEWRSSLRGGTAGNTRGGPTRWRAWWSACHERPGRKEGEEKAGPEGPARWIRRRPGRPGRVREVGSRQNGRSSSAWGGSEAGAL